MSIVNSTAATAVAPPKLSRRRWGIILILLLAAVVNYLDRANLSIADFEGVWFFRYRNGSATIGVSLALCAGEPTSGLVGRPLRS